MIAAQNSLLSMSKRPVLTAVDFGKRIAEEEADALESYFVETEQWRKVFAGDIDIVYGPKGSGKSAIYSLLLKKAEELASRSIVLIPGENMMGAPVFADLATEKASSEERLRGLWKLYFLCLLAGTFRSRGIDTDSAKVMIQYLEDAALVPKEWNLRRVLGRVRDYLRGLEVSGEVKVNPETGMPELGGKITLGEPTGEQRNQGYVSADYLLDLAEEALQAVNLKVWIALDRLDVAFVDSDELETNALRALFRVYLDILGFHHISLKIFLRDDIWQKITATGFREASHITRYTRITWDQQSLLNLVLRRALKNVELRSNYKVTAEAVLSDAKLQEDTFYRIFPAQVDSGKGKTPTLNWLLSRTADGKKQNAPRELIHLISAAREQQLRLLEIGNPEPPGEVLIDRAALKAGLPEVSRERFHQTLCAEHPLLKEFLLKLEGKKTHQTAKSLAKIWGISEVKALTMAEKLAEVGFFEKREITGQQMFWVPFIYREELKMVQGQAK